MSFQETLPSLHRRGVNPRTDGPARGACVGVCKRAFTLFSDSRKWQNTRYDNSFFKAARKALRTGER